MHKKHWITALLGFILLWTSFLLMGCSNTGLGFLDDVYDTLCCFSPAVILPAGCLVIYAAKRL